MSLVMAITLMVIVTVASQLKGLGEKPLKEGQEDSQSVDNVQLSENVAQRS